MKLEKKNDSFILELDKQEIEELIRDGKMESQWWDDFDYDDLEKLYKKVGK